MCKVCAVKEASIIDSLNAKTSLDLAHAAQILYSMNAEESKVLAKASAEYWQSPKEIVAAEMVNEKAEPRKEPNIGQAESNNPFEIDPQGVIRFRGQTIARLEVTPIGVAFRRM